MTDCEEDCTLIKQQLIVPFRRFPLPDVPAGWKPNPKRVWEMEKNKENQGPDQPAKGEKHAEPPKTRAEWKSSLLSADEVCFA